MQESILLVLEQLNTQTAIPDNPVLALLFALGFGALSFISPCVLPLIPAYLSFISGLTVNELQDTENSDRRKRLAKVFFTTLVFVLGFTAVFVAMGAAAGSLSRIIFSNRILFNRIAGLIILVLGLHMTGVFRIGFLMQEKKFHLQNNPLGILGVFLIGAAFAFGWTPCIGPMLAAILGLAAQQNTAGQGMMLLAVYSLGLGIPFLITGLFINGFMGIYKRMRRHLRTVEIVAGIVLLIVGVLIFFDLFTVLSGYLSQIFPFLLEIG